MRIPATVTAILREFPDWRLVIEDGDGVDWLVAFEELDCDYGHSLVADAFHPDLETALHLLAEKA